MNLEACLRCGVAAVLALEKILTVASWCYASRLLYDMNRAFLQLLHAGYSICVAFARTGREHQINMRMN
jgi:hypothetical protein